MGQLTLQTLGGIDRRRPKGGASTKALYDLENAYIDGTGAAVQRPGVATAYTLPAGTVGLTAFGGALVVYSHTDPGAMPDGVTCEILTHPDDSSQALVRVHFAGAIMGFLYVVAQFEDGAVYHYWLQRRGSWEANTDYRLGDIVEPTVRNGYGYRVERVGDPNPVWTAGAARAVADVVEPTTSNGFKYTVTAVAGAAPKSGATEPTWPTQAGATVFEDTDLTPPPTTVTGPFVDPDNIPDDVRDRYDNPAGSFPGMGSR